MIHAVVCTSTNWGCFSPCYFVLFNSSLVYSGSRDKQQDFHHFSGMFVELEINTISWHPYEAQGEMSPRNFSKGEYFEVHIFFQLKYSIQLDQSDEPLSKTELLTPFRTFLMVQVERWSRTEPLEAIKKPSLRDSSDDLFGGDESKNLL